MARKRIYKMLRRAVSNPRASWCGSAKLSELDFRFWFTDRLMVGATGTHYLHVKKKGGDTWHRVYCRLHERPRLAFAKGKLDWLIDGYNVP